MTLDADPRSDLLLARLTAHPENRKVIKPLLAGLSKPDQVALLVAVQHRAGRLFTAALVTILELDEGFDATVLGDLRLTHLQDPAQASLTQLWQAVGRGESIPEGLSFTAEEARAHYGLCAPERLVIRHDTRKKPELERLTALGLNPKTLRALVVSFLTLDPNWAGILANAKFATPLAREIVERTESYCGYQDRAIASRHLHFIDPFTGEDLTPIDSCLMFGRSCYLFPGRHPFYLICAGAGAKPLGLFFVGLNLIIDFGAGISKFLSVGLFANTYGLLSARFLQHRKLYNAALTAPRPSEVELHVTTHMAANPAHHLWNFFTPLERIIQAGHADRVARLFTGGTEFYGPLAEVFPEFADKIQDGAKPGVLDPLPFDPCRLLLTMGGYFIAQSLKERMRRVARGARNRRFDPDQIAALTARARPVLWIGMRLGDKSWKDQEAGIQALAEGLFQRHPETLILLDGFSYPVGRDEISQKWAGVIAELNGVAERVIASLPGRGVVNLVGTTLADAVLWAEKTDVYLTPVGSSQHKVGWLSRAPGLIYSAPRTRGKPGDQRLPGYWEAEGSPIPNYVFGVSVDSGQRKNAGDRRPQLDNVELDAQDLLARICALIEG